jgi:NAD(P)-dependent dehydrogenase (short-subunit alcohol dehydrogenase family)
MSTEHPRRTLSADTRPHAGRRALVTGASNGIGRAIADRLAAGGAAVTGLDVEPPADDPWPVVRYDLSRTAGLEALVEHLDLDGGGVDILVNAAGIQRHFDVARPSAEILREVLAVDLEAPLLLASLLGVRMADRGYGRILNVTSVHAALGERGGLAYDSAKAGLEQATRTMAIELGGRGVLCNAVAPGFVETGMAIVDGVLETRTSRFEELYLRSGRIPLGRAAAAADVAGVSSWLCSTDNTYVTGQVIRVDGGMSVTL